MSRNIPSLPISSTLASIQHLPYELLEEIFDLADLQLAHLFKLSTYSSQLQRACLYLYIKKSGIPRPEELCVVTIPYAPLSHNLLTALTRAPNITHIRRFQCIFPHGGNMNIKTMFRHVRRLYHLIEKLSSVDHVVLSFDPDVQRWAEDIQNLTDEQIEQWCLILGSLFSIIIQRRCLSLEVHGLHHLLNVGGYYGFRKIVPLKPIPYHIPFEPAPTSTLSNITSFLSSWSGLGASANDVTEEDYPNILLGPIWISEATSTSIPQPEMVVPRLERLTLFNSPSMLQPPLSQWTRSILKNAPVSTLNLQKFTTSPERLRALTSGPCPLSTPKIQVLTLHNIKGVGRQDIAAFIDHFSGLRYVSVEKIWAIGPTPRWELKGEFRPAFASWTTLTELHLSKHWIVSKHLLEVLPSMHALKDLYIALGSEVYLSQLHVYSGDDEILEIVSLLQGLQESTSWTPHFFVNLDIRVPREAAILTKYTIGETGHRGRGSWDKSVTGVLLTFKQAMWHPDIDRVTPLLALLPNVRKVEMKAICGMEEVERVQESIEDMLKTASVRRALAEKEVVLVNGRTWRPL